MSCWTPDERRILAGNTTFRPWKHRSAESRCSQRPEAVGARVVTESCTLTRDDLGAQVRGRPVPRNDRYEALQVKADIAGIAKLVEPANLHALAAVKRQGDLFDESATLSLPEFSALAAGIGRSDAPGPLVTVRFPGRFDREWFDKRKRNLNGGATDGGPTAAQTAGGSRRLAGAARQAATWAS